MGCSPWGRKELDTTERLTQERSAVDGILGVSQLPFQCSVQDDVLVVADFVLRQSHWPAV